MSEIDSNAYHWPVGINDTTVLCSFRKYINTGCSAPEAATRTAEEINLPFETVYSDLINSKTVLTDDEKIDLAATRILKKHKNAFRKLAK